MVVLSSVYKLGKQTEGSTIYIKEKDIMPKPGKHKKTCERYKSQGRLEINKEKKAERDKRRIEKFRKRREAGKAYEYKPIPDEIKNDKKMYYEELRSRAEKNQDRRLPLQKEISRMAKLERELAIQERQNRLLNEDWNKGKTHYKKKAHNANRDDSVTNAEEVG